MQLAMHEISILQTFLPVQIYRMLKILHNTFQHINKGYFNNISKFSALIIEFLVI